MEDDIMGTATDVVKLVLPWIGTALGGPLGGGIATFAASKLGISDSSVKAVTEAISGMVGDPEQVAKLRSIEHEFQEHMAELGYTHIEKLEELNTRGIEAVNTTMQSESAAEHWPSYSWRPAIGFSFAAYITAQWLLPLFHITPPVISSELMIAIGGILGVASWFRGKAQADPAVSISNKG
jgi:hypothetical protein